MFHRSERLFLRPAWPEDWHEIEARQPASDESFSGEQQASSATCYHAPRPSWRRHEPVSRNFILTLPEPSPSRQGDGIIGWAALLRESDQRARELGVKLWVAPEYRGQGFGGECLKALMDIALMLRTEKVYTLIPDAEHKAQRMVRAAGFEVLQHITDRSEPVGQHGPDFPASILDGAHEIVPARLYSCEMAKLSQTMQAQRPMACAD